MDFTIGKKRIVIGLLFGIASLLTCAFLYSIKAGIVFFLLFLVSSLFIVRNTNTIIRIIGFLSAIIGIGIISQLIVEANQLWKLKFIGVVVELLDIAIVFGLFNILVDNEKISIALGGTVIILFSAIARYVFAFRGTEMSPMDLFTINTANNVVSDYIFLPYSGLIYGLILFILILFSYPDMTSGHHKRGSRIKKIVFEIIIIVVWFFFIQFVEIYTWSTEGSNFQGYLTNFSAQLVATLKDKEPDNYSEAIIRKLEEEYQDSGSYVMNKPDIIVVMDESFADLRIVGDNIHSAREITPFYDSIYKDAIKGYALSSVFGGGTANSEYEFLTGNTMAFVIHGATVYQMYLNKQSYSLASYLKECGYYCHATHPYLSSGWARTKAYPFLGFDSYSFIEDYPNKKRVRERISDQEMFEYIENYYEDRKKGNDQPMFIFGVSMQNHGGYNYTGEGYSPRIELYGYQNHYSDAEQYFGLINETDKALEQFIDYFKNVNHDVVICFFGDHLPSLNQAFYQEIHGNDFDTLDEKQLQYTVPFFVLANFDIEEKEIDLTSINYLSTYVLEAAGIKLPPYNMFLRRMEKTIPSINSNGYYSKIHKRMILLKEAEGEEKDILAKYEMLQYNSLFDSIENRSGIFFPLLNEQFFR